MFSLADRNVNFKPGTNVLFQLGTSSDGIRKPFNMKLASPKQQDGRGRGANSDLMKKGRVESIKGHVS